jgi:hypothetical protein
MAQILVQLFAEIVVTIASSLAVMSGYGFVLFCSPLLSLIYDPVSVVFMSLMMGTVLLGGLLCLPENRQCANFRLAIWLTLLSILGMPVGLWLLPRLNESVFRIIVGTVTVIFVVSRLVGVKVLLPGARLRIALAGFLGGVFSTSSGLSALPLLWLLGGQDVSPLEYRSTIAAYVFMNGVISVFAMAFNGAIRLFDFKQLIMLCPALCIGLVLGTVLSRKLSPRQLERGSLYYLGVIGVLTGLLIKL